MATLTIDKTFAENLGLAFGGCVRDQTLGFFNKEAAKAAGVKLSPLPFVGAEDKRRFKAQFAALLQAVGTWAAVNTLPEYRADDKFLRKTVFNMQLYAEEALKAKIFSKLSKEDVKTYVETRRQLMRLGQNATTDKETLARAFLSCLHGESTQSFSERQVMDVAQQIGMANRLFEQLATISRKEPHAYEKKRPQKK